MRDRRATHNSGDNNVGNGAYFAKNHFLESGFIWTKRKTGELMYAL